VPSRLSSPATLAEILELAVFFQAKRAAQSVKSLRLARCVVPMSGRECRKKRSGKGSGRTDDRALRAIKRTVNAKNKGLIPVHLG